MRRCESRPKRRVDPAYKNFARCFAAAESAWPNSHLARPCGSQTTEPNTLYTDRPRIRDTTRSHCWSIPKRSQSFADIQRHSRLPESPQHRHSPTLANSSSHVEALALHCPMENVAFSNNEY